MKTLVIAPRWSSAPGRMNTNMFTDEEIALMILAGDCLTPEEFVERYGMGIQGWPSRKVLVRWTSVDENVAGALLSTWDKQYGWVRIR